MSLTTLQQMAVSALSYNDILVLVDVDNNSQWTIKRLIETGQIAGATINSNDELVITKPELTALNSMLDWELVNAKSASLTGFAAVAFQTPEVGSTPGDIAFGFRGTWGEGQDWTQLLKDVITDAQIAVQGSTTSEPNQFNEAFDFYTDTLSTTNNYYGGYTDYTFTGHSLGGGLAQYLTYMSNNVGESVTFNAVGIGQALDGVTNFSSYNVTDYVNENDVVGHYGTQLGSTVYLQDADPNALTSTDIGKAAIWISIVNGVNVGTISATIGTLVMSDLAAALTPGSNSVIEDAFGLGAHGLHTMLNGPDSNGEYHLTSTASGSNMGVVVTAATGLAAGASFVVDGLTYITIAADANFRVAISVGQGAINVLTTVGGVTNQFIHALAATAQEIVHQAGQAIQAIGDAVATGVWEKWVQFFSNKYVADGTSSTETMSGYANKTNILRAFDGDDMVVGQNLDDFLWGGNGADTIRGDSGNDLIYGESGNDILYGDAADDMIFGGAGDDIIYGDIYEYSGRTTSIGNDTIDGGSGNDSLQGGAGDDMYMFGKGYGQDTISEIIYMGSYYSAYQVDGGYDTVKFLAGVNPSEVEVTRTGSDLILSITSTSDVLTVQNFFGQTQSGERWSAIEKVIFSDTNHTIWTQADLLEKARYIKGTSETEYLIGYSDQDDIVTAGAGDDISTTGAGNDYISGEAGNDTLTGEAGNDTLLGGSGNDTLIGDDVSYNYGITSTVGNDILDGGSGNDTLAGQGGDDTYIFGIGYGQDTILDNINVGSWYSSYTIDGGFDTISFLEGVEPKNVKVTRLGGDLIFTLIGTTDSLTVQGFFSRNTRRDSSGPLDNAIEQVVFADSSQTIWTKADLLEMARYINGTSGDDALTGYDYQDDVIVTGAGNDLVNGTGDGEDYVSVGSGDDTVYAGSGNAYIDAGSGNDTVYGYGGDDTIIGGDGNDTLYGDEGQVSQLGSSGNDILDGGAGNDSLRGGNGNDAYIFGIGYGQDTIVDEVYTFLNPWYTEHNGGFDTISFLAGIEPEDINITRSGNDLIFSIADTDDTLTVQGHFGRKLDGSYFNAIEQVVFADANETVWSQADLFEKARYINGTSSDDALTGYDYQDDVITVGDGDDLVNGTGDGSDYVSSGAGNDTIYMGSGDGHVDSGSGNDIVYGNGGNDNLLGEDGNDTLYGDTDAQHGIDNDILDGGTGNDTLYGSGGDDTYVFGIGYGQDYISDTLFAGSWGYQSAINAGFDKILLKEGIEPEDITLSREGYNLILTINNTSDKLTLENYFSKDGSGNYIYAIEEIHFSNSSQTVWVLADIIDGARHIYGTSSDDYLTGYDDQNDIITLDDGNDMLYNAFAGNDVIDAGNGDDNITGGAGDDVLNGEAGNDSLYGDYSSNYPYAQIGNDTLDGGEGNDSLFGGAGDDTYIFGLGYGQDTIEDRHYQYYNGTGYLNGGFDRILFKPGIEPANVKVSRVGGDLVFSIEATSDTLTIQGFFNKNNNQDYINAIEEVHFSDTAETIRDLASLVESARFINGTSANDDVYGFDDQDDVIDLGEGNDTLWGAFAGNDIAHGGTGNDSLTGGAGDDQLYGDEGDDILNGDHSQYYSYVTGADLLDGGTGNDTLNGGARDDTYVFGLGYGQDTIEDRHYQYGNGAYYSGGFDKVAFKEGINPEDVSVSRSGNNLVLSISGTGDTLTIQNFFTKNYSSEYVYAVEEIHFADTAETVWDLSDLLDKARFIIGTSLNDDLYGFDDQDDVLSLGDGNDTLWSAFAGNDIVYAGDGNDTITGGAGDDELHGDAGDDILNGDHSQYYSYVTGSDILDGGTGNDSLNGGAGDDTYVFGLGYGQDVIEDRHYQYGNGAYYSGGFDKVQMKEGVAPEDVTISRDGMNLIIAINGTSDALTVQNFFAKNYSNEYVYAIEEIHFSDANQTVWDFAGIFERGMQTFGTAGNDTFTGYQEDDYIDLGAGDDILYGSAGNDIVWAGSGNDVIDGGADNDILFGAEGDDILYGDGNPSSLYSSGIIGSDELDGGAGNDTLYGGAGDDTYLFKPESGNDIVIDPNMQTIGYNSISGGYDRIKVFYNPEYIRLFRADDDLVFTIHGSMTDTLTVQNYFALDAYGNPAYNIEEVVFDGLDTVWDQSAIDHRLRYVWGDDTTEELEGISDRSDTIMAFDGDDTITDDGDHSDTIFAGLGNDTVFASSAGDNIWGEAGDDVLYGRAGSDIIIGGYGEDTIVGGTDNDVLYGENGNDTYLFSVGDGQDIINDTADQDLIKHAYSYLDTIFTQDGDNLNITVAGSTDSISVQSWFLSTDNQIETIEATDGSVITNSQIELLIQAMATYSSTNSISWLDAISTNPNDVQSILAQYWTAPTS